MNNLSLYTLATEYRVDLERLADLDLDEQTLLDTLDGLSGDLEAKAQNVVAFSRHLDKLAEAIKEAETDMARRRKAIEVRAEGVRNYVLDAMRIAGIQKIECPWFSLSITKNPPAVEIDDERMVPEVYRVTPPPPPKQIDKAAIKKALLDGVDVPGARLRQGVRLNIK
jgi:hypothetical protein